MHAPNFTNSAPAVAAATACYHKRPNEPANLALALSLATSGFPIYVCGPNKKPRFPGGYKTATRDPIIVTSWFADCPHGLVAMPTGPTTGFWVSDFDGREGEISRNAVLAALGLEQFADLTSYIVRTPSTGWHGYFSCVNGELPRSRASDIEPGFDTRGIGGGIIAPGNVLPDGRRYQRVDTQDLTTPIDAELSVLDLPPAPRDLLWLATFGVRERKIIDANDDLRDLLRAAQPGDWQSNFDAWQAARYAETAARIGPCDDPSGYRAQSLEDLKSAATEFAALQDGRRTGLFRIACRVGKYVGHGHLSDAEFRAAFIEAARTNGALQKHGLHWAENAIRSAIDRARNDALPPLAREFRKIGGR